MLSDFIAVTFVAILILGVKVLLKDKLSPRWQYVVWSILAVRILLPVNIKRYILLPVYIWIEVGKSVLEKRLHSNFTNIHELIRLEHSFPYIKKSPESITDWLFIIYIAGLICMLFWYTILYIKLRILLNQAEEPAENQKIHIIEVGKKVWFESVQGKMCSWNLQI